MSRWPRRAFDRASGVLPYLMLAVVFGLSLWLIQHNYDLDTQRSCRDRQAGREVLREVIVAATSGGGGVDYTKLSSFGDLDPELKQFLIELQQTSAARSASDTANQFRQQLLDRAPPVSCD